MRILVSPTSAYSQRYTIQLLYTVKEHAYLSALFAKLHLSITTTRIPFGLNMTLQYFQETNSELLRYVTKKLQAIDTSTQYIDAINDELNDPGRVNIAIFRVGAFRSLSGTYYTPAIPIRLWSAHSFKIFIVNLQHAYDAIFDDHSTLEGVFGRLSNTNTSSRYSHNNDDRASGLGALFG